MHVCIFDRECLKHFWRYGAPLRVHWGKEPKNRHFFTIPGTGWASNWRSRYLFDWDNAVEVKGKDFSTGESEEFYTTEEEFDRMWKEAIPVKAVSSIGLRWYLIKRYFGFS